MKKVFSLLLVVAMIASLSVVSFAAPANEAGGMHTVITDNGATATVDVYITNGEYVNGFTTYILSDAVTYADGAEACGPFAGCDTFTPTTDKAGYIKFVVSWNSNDKAANITDATKVLTYNVNKVDASAKLTEADFAYSTSTIKVSKVTTVNSGLVAGVAGGNNFTTAKQPAYFTFEVVGNEPEEEVFEITSTGTALDANDTMKDKDGKDVVAAGDKVIAIFAKNVSDAEIAAGSYGIIFGGVRYAGQAVVPAKTAWAIKLVGSADQLPAGSYAYSIFSGDAVVEATAPWVID